LSLGINCSPAQVSNGEHSISLNLRNEHSFRIIKKIHKLEKKIETQCIKVDSPSSTYLCTKHLIPTHNTGSLKDWNTQEEKTYAKLFDDPQLRFYHYAVSQIYGEDKTYIITIFYLKTNDCFQIPFGKEDLKKTKNMLKQRFEEIKETKIPKLNRGWKCTRFCPFGKNTTEGTNFPNLVQLDYGGIAKVGEMMTICDCSNHEIHTKGIDYVQENYGKYKKNNK
jgi:CRISPR/Cas system-associated exonuclease Cas4 (RecB family)